MKPLTQGSYKTRRMIFLFLLCSFLLSPLSVSAEASTVASGTCGDNLTWTLDDAGLLTINGTGLMNDYNNPHECPWNAKQSLIKSVTISDGVISIGSNAFADCINLSSFVIPSSITSIGNLAFINCEKLVNFNFPDTIINIGIGAFLGCHGLTDISIPAGVNRIGEAAFSACAKLTYITVSPNNLNYSSLNGVLFNKDKTLLSCYPAGIRDISYRLPSTVTAIADYAFVISDYLESLFIPESVRSVGIYAFEYCDNLHKVTYSGTEEQWQEIEVNEGNECLLNADISYTSIIHQGVCGNLHWDIDNTGLLMIYGSGEMMNFENDENLAWKKYADYIKSIIIEPGITSIGEWAFENCTSMSDISIPDSIIKISDYAFCSCLDLTTVLFSGALIQAKEIIFGEMSGCLLSADWKCSDAHSKLTDLSYEGVTETGIIWHYTDKKLIISGEGAIIDKPWSFLNDSLLDIQISQGITSIGDEAFLYCNSLMDIEIPSSVISIGKRAFAFCNRLVGIIIPDGVTSIGESAFTHCGSLNSVSIPNSINTIGEEAFSYCRNLIDIVIPDNVTQISDGTFSYCSRLRSVVLPDGITSIGESAFSYCYNLMSIKIPDSISVIGEWTFGYCYSLSNITLPANISTIGEYAFYGCSGLTTINYPGTFAQIQSIRIEKNNNELSIVTWICSDKQGKPSDFDFEGLSEDGLYWKYTSDGILTISGTGMMSDNPWSFLSITIKSVIIYNGVINIGYEAFKECDNLMSIIIPDSVTMIGREAFAYCNNIESVTIPDSVTSIGEYAFRGCINLKDINLPNNVTVIDMGTFEDCINLEKIILPNNISNICDSAFRQCSSLKQLTLPNSLLNIEGYAFEGCTNLENITISDNLKTIGDKAFYRCYNLLSVRFSEDNPVQYDYHYYDRYIYAVALPSTIESIGTDIFGGTPFGTKMNPDLVLPWKLSVIEEEAFYGNNATFIYIPSDVTYIGHQAFADCKNLTLVLFEMPWRDHITIENDAFDNTDCILIFEQDDYDLNTYAEQHNFKVIRYEGSNG